MVYHNLRGSVRFQERTLLPDYNDIMFRKFLFYSLYSSYAKRIFYSTYTQLKIKIQLLELKS
jgi:hypothetical protein